MAWQQTPYLVPLLATGGLLLSFAAYLWYIGRDRHVLGTTLGSLLMFAGAYWVLTYAVQLSSATLSGKIFWVYVGFIGVLALPITWIAYVLWYTGHTEWLSWRTFGPLVGIAGSILLLVLTNGSHRLVFREFGLEQVSSFVVLVPVYGPGFWAFMAFAYTLIGLSVVLLASAAIHARGIFRWQIAVLFLFALIPGTTGLLFVSGVNPLPGLNIAALSNMFTAAAGLVSLVRFKWMDITPIARDQAFESMTEAAVVFDTDHRIVDVNPQAARFIRGPADDAVGTPVTDVLPDVTSALEHLDETDSDTSDSGVRDEVVLVAPDGRRVLDLRLSFIEPSVGGKAGYTLLLRDITARKRAEDRAKRRREKIEQLHRVARDLTAARSVEDVFQRAVDGGHHVVGADVCRLAVAESDRLVPTASSIDEDVDEWHGPANARRYTDYSYESGTPVLVDDLTEDGCAPSGFLARSDRNGPDEAPETDYPERTYRSLLSVPVGEIGSIQVLSRDRAAFGENDREVLELLASHVETAVDRIRAEANLRNERDRLEEFASVVSHDLRNPLNVAQGRLELIREDAPNEHVDPIDHALSRMDTIITDVLTLAQEGESVGDMETVELAACIDEAWAAVDTESATLQRDGDLGDVRADESRLRELLENLYRNAIDHAGPDVTVRVGSLGDGTGFYVEDDGPGIPEDERDQVLEYGYSTAPDGTGFGLAIVKRIADAHDWTVTIGDGSLGGARFEIATSTRHGRTEDHVAI